MIIDLINILRTLFIIEKQGKENYHLYISKPLIQPVDLEKNHMKHFGVKLAEQ